MVLDKGIFKILSDHPLSIITSLGPDVRVLEKDDLYISRIYDTLFSRSKIKTLKKIEECTNFYLIRTANCFFKYFIYDNK